MSSPGIAIERTLGAGSTRAINRQQRTNTVLSVVLVAVVAIAPIPLGSNRPFFWALWATVLGLVAVGYALDLLRNGEPLRFALGRLLLPLLLFVLLAIFLMAQTLPLGATSFTTAAGDAVASQTFSLAPGSTWLMLIQFASYGLFFLLALQVAVNRRRARIIGIAILIVVVVHALYGLAALTLFGDTLLFAEKWAYEGFATGTFVNRNSYATFLAFGLVLSVVLAARDVVQTEDRGRAGAMPLYLVAAGLILAALLATGSRMGLLAGLISAGCATVMAMQKRLGERGRFRWLTTAALPILAAVAIVALYGGETFERLGSVEAAANVRGDLYQQVWAMIAARPWLGYGGGAFEVAYPLFHQPPVSVDLTWDKAHSTYLGLWAELGVVAGSLPLLLVALFAVWALVLYARRSGDWALPAAAVSVVVVAALHSIVDFSLEIEANVFLFLAILALGIASPASRDTSPSEA